MIAPRFLPLILKHITRHPARSGLTLVGIAMAMFLFLGIQAMHSGVEQATTAAEDDNQLIVYRENRYCPFTSQLPEHYSRQIEELPGVAAAIPVKIEVSTCRASLDVVTFRGVPPEEFQQTMMTGVEVVAGSIQDWQRRGDAAILGERMAERRDLDIGDRISIAGITVTVAGIISSPHPQDANVAYTHLEFIQRSAGNTDGVVTQFNVTVEDPGQLDAVAASIDELFRSSQAPTTTSSEKAFTAQAASDLVEIARVARWLGWAALVAVFALVANAIILSVQERVRDHAVLQTLGYSGPLITRLIVLEGVLVSLIGGAVGLAAGKVVLAWRTFSFTAEGVSVNIEAGMHTVATGLLLCTLIGLLAGLYPGWRAGRREIASCFRAV